MNKRKLVILTTVPETILTILSGQPKYLSSYYDVTIVTSPGEEDKIISIEGVNVKTVLMKRGISVFSDVKSIISLIVIIRNIKPDIVHSYTPKAGLVGMLSSFFCKVTTRVHTFTGLIFPTERGLKKQLLLNIDRIICFCATSVVPEGNGVKNDLINYGITRRKMNVIGSGNIAGVDVDYFKNTNHFPKNELFTFVYVGRLNADKGINELLTAFNWLPDASTRLLIVGGKDISKPISNQLMEMIVNSHRIDYVGFVEDIRPSLSRSDCLILPSYREGFPNVVLQAGAMGLPCIVTDVNGSNEIIANDINGWVVPPRDAEALHNAMKIAINDNDIERKKIAARNNVVNNFERRSYLDKLKCFYQNITG